MPNILPAATRAGQETRVSISIFSNDPHREFYFYHGGPGDLNICSFSLQAPLFSEFLNGAKRRQKQNNPRRKRKTGLQNILENKIQVHVQADWIESCFEDRDAPSSEVGKFSFALSPQKKIAINYRLSDSDMSLKKSQDEESRVYVVSDLL